MKFKKAYIGRFAQAIIISVALVAVIGFAERSQEGEVCKDVIVKLENQFENFFIDEHDILMLMTNQGLSPIQGTSFDELNLKEIEERVKSDRFVKTAQIYKDLKGNITVHANLRRPFARVLQHDGPDAYIAMDGAVLPISEKFNTRGVVLTGAYVKELVKDDLTINEEGQKIFALLKFIYEDEFWKAQIAQIDISSDLDIKLYPQVTKQVVEFGQPEDVEKKFQKLRIFYNEILPRKGWNKYERVNLKYKNQIVAE